MRLRVLSRAACLGFSAIALLLVLRRVDLVSLSALLARAKLTWLVAAWAIFGVAFALAAARWHLVLRLGHCQVHPGATMRSVLVGHLFNTVLFGPTGGDIGKSAVYARWYHFRVSHVLASCVLDRFLGGVGFLVFASFTPGFAAYGGHWWDRLARVVTVPRLFASATAVLVLLFTLHQLRRRLHWSPWRHLTHAFFSNGARLMQQPRLAARGIVYAVLSHVCISCVFLFSLEAITQTDFSLPALFWVFPVISLVTSAPVTFSGAGLREGAALFLLGLYGIPAADAIAASLLVLCVYLLWALIGAYLFWRREAASERLGSVGEPKTLSVVIPTWNEAQALPETVARARQVPEITEFIVADGGSTDGTAALADRLGCSVVCGPRGRGAQLRAGAARARGDVVLLLHADTWLPPDAGRALLNCLHDQLVVGGGFWKVFREKNLFMAGSRVRCAVRLFLFGRVMGDQVMFARREALEAIGGVPEVPLMEEFELCRRLRAIGSLALAGATVSTSARRFAKLGVVRTYLRMWYVTLRYYFGTSLQKLQKIYDPD